MKNAVFLTVLFCLVSGLAAQDLRIGPEDIRIIQSPDGGYHLYIKKKPDIQSVLLTESTRDPSHQAASYAYRAPEWNPVNGDEKRMLDGQFIPPESRIFSLIDSTPETRTPLGEAFHIWIPWVLQYGYSWTRHGEIQVLDGTYINIRAFSKPYGDYTGKFLDNPYRLRFTQKPVEQPAPDSVQYSKGAVEKFSSLAQATNGRMRYAQGPEDLIPLIRANLEPAGSRGLDLIVVLDATESMIDDIDEIRRSIIPVLEDVLVPWPSWRIALVLYKDYFDDFLTKNACAFTNDLGVFRRALSSFRVQGGRDIPEAVYEGLDAALAYPWTRENEKRIILIGDAPPHPKPRGRVTEQGVLSRAAELDVQIDVIILPHGSTD